MDAVKQCLINRLTFLYLISVMVSFLFCYTDPLFGRKRPLAFLLVFMWHLPLLQKLRFPHNVTSFFSKSSQHHASVDANVDSLTCSLVLIDFNQVFLVIYSHIDWFLFNSSCSLHMKPYIFQMGTLYLIPNPCLHYYSIAISDNFFIEHSCYLKWTSSQILGGFDWNHRLKCQHKSGWGLDFWNPFL